MQKMIKMFIVMLLFGTFLMPIINGNDNKIMMQISIVSIDPEAPDPPTITGPTEGKLNIRYTYEIISEDPQCDDICYTVMCSDLPAIYKTQYCESGYAIVYNHSWDDFYQTEPPYFITAKATDCKGHESEWSSIEISIPKNNAMQIPNVKPSNSIWFIRGIFRFLDEDEDYIYLKALSAKLRGFGNGFAVYHLFFCPIKISKPFYGMLPEKSLTLPVIGICKEWDYT